MRNRFFFIILATLVIAAVGINLVHANFFKSQRLKLIDKQISESSEALLNSPDLLKAVQRPELLEDTISEVLQGARIGKVFVLRDSKGKIVYQSFNVGLLNTELPTHPEWVAVESKEEFVRLRNVVLKGKRSFILQVGLVLDRNFLNWEIIDSRVVNYVSGIVISLFLASVILTLILLSPLRLLNKHLKEATSNLANLKDVQPLPKHVMRFTRGFWAQSDEFSSLVNTAQKLIDRINLNYKLTRSWTLQMAHELKTPLAIMRVETDTKRKAGLLPEGYAKDLLKEIHQMSEIINQFLDWAELENSQVQKDVYALRMKTLVKDTIERLDKISPGRIRLHLESDFAVFANPIHLDQLITNLITNALKFSPASKNVEFFLGDHCLTIQDYGQGIPREVRERIGEPFNVGIHQEEGLAGNGLGLAWVSTVAKIYQWDFMIQSDGTGTMVSVRFPTTEP